MNLREFTERMIRKQLCPMLKKQIKSQINMDHMILVIKSFFEHITECSKNDY
jgi:hypothetical protein